MVPKGRVRNSRNAHKFTYPAHALTRTWMRKAANKTSEIASRVAWAFIYAVTQPNPKD